MLLAFCPLFAALYPLTQVYQFEEDARRGDHTLALRLGVHRSLDVSLVAVGIAFAVFAWAGRHAQWSGHEGWRWLALGIALAAWLAVVLPWRARAGRMSPAQHQRGMYLALVAWAITDAAVLVAWGT